MLHFQYLGVLFIVVSTCLSAAAQPVTNSATLISLDLDLNGRPEVSYAVSSDLHSMEPVTWAVGFGLSPKGGSRILTPVTERLYFQPGEEIGQNSIAYTNVVPDLPRPPILLFGFSLLSYRAIEEDEWIYSVRPGSTFHDLSQCIIGFRFELGDGPHFGWLKFSRSNIDAHTPFTLTEYAVHPMVNFPIGAGEMPLIGDIEVAISGDSVRLIWSEELGHVALQSCTNLSPRGQWTELGTHQGGVIIPLKAHSIQWFRLVRSVTRIVPH